MHTYDIINAGPRNRFQANGYIVSNSGSGIQPQNFSARIKISADPEEMLGVVVAGGYDLLTDFYADDPMAVAGACVRSVLTAKEGYDLIVCDFSAVEGRGIAWLAGEESELDVYRSGKDPYIAAAAIALRKPYDAVTPEERSRVGKPSTLSFGYGGSVGAFRKFGGEDMTDEEIKTERVQPWREAHPMTVQFWRELEDACMNAVKEPGKIFSFRSISFRVKDKFLMCRLPSGRTLFYYGPKVESELMYLTRDGEYFKANSSKLKMSDVIRKDTKYKTTYMTVDGMTKQWIRTDTFGGKLSENVTSAICRDLMAQAMLRIEAAGYPVVLSVHDEIASEVPEGFGSVEEFERIMCMVPTWANGFPIEAHGFRSRRYRK